MTVHTYLGLISHQYSVGNLAYPVVILPNTDEWGLTGREVLVIRDPGDIDIDWPADEPEIGWEQFARNWQETARHFSRNADHWLEQATKAKTRVAELETELRELDELPLAQMTKKQLRRRVKELRRAKRKADENTIAVMERATRAEARVAELEATVYELWPKKAQ